MTRSGLVILACAIAVMLGGCEQTKKALRLTKSAPDEFAVYSRAPLSLPPDYGLRPPAPGTGRPQEIEPKRQAERAVLGAGGRGGAPAAAVGPAGASPGLQTLLREMGALNVDPNIRAIINRETTILAEEDKTFADRIMFWQKQTEPGTLVDADKETRRIRENQALGRAITEGETPIIERRRRALLEGLFD